MPTIEERVSTLEDVFQRFLLSTEKTLARMERDTQKLKAEMAEFKNEMHEFKNEMKEFKNEMLIFKEESVAWRNKMDADRDRMYKQWGELANKLGTLAEDIVYPNMATVAAKYFGCPKPNDIMLRRTRRRPDNRIQVQEYDVIVECTGTILINETKSTPRPNHIEEFLKIQEEFFLFFPEYQGRKVILIYASLYIDQRFAELLAKNGIYAMALKGDTMDLINFDSVAA